MTKDTVVKVVDTIPPRTGEENNLPAFVKVATYHPSWGEETKLMLQRYLLTKIETVINRDEALAVTKALLQHFAITIDELGTVEADLPGMNFIIIYGPEGFNNTANTQAIQKHYNAYTVIDIDSSYAGLDLEGLRLADILNNAVVLLTTQSGSDLYELRRRLGRDGIKAVQYSFDEFLAARLKVCDHTWIPLYDIGSGKPSGHICSQCNVER